MELDELRAFVRTAELGGLAAAGRATGLPKSNVSRLVQALETSIGAKLLQRSARGSGLTEDGQDFLKHAKRILAEVDEAEASIAQRGRAPRGILRITAPHALGSRFIAPLLPRILADAPDLRIDLHLTSRRVDLVEEGFDLALRVGQPVDSSLKMRRLAANPIRLCASPKYLDRAGVPTSPRDLELHQLLLLRRPTGEARITLTRADERAQLRLIPRLACDDPAILVGAALEGAGIASVPLVLGHEHIARGALVEVLPEWHPPELIIFALFPSARGAVPRVRMFLDHLVAVLAAPVPQAVDEDHEGALVGTS